MDVKSNGRGKGRKVEEMISRGDKTAKVPSCIGEGAGYIYLLRTGEERLVCCFLETRGCYLKLCKEGTGIFSYVTEAVSRDMSWPVSWIFPGTRNRGQSNGDLLLPADRSWNKRQNESIETHIRRISMVVRL